MRKLLLLAALVAGAFIVGTPSMARADHFSCGPGFGGGYYGYPGYLQSYYAPVYSYNYGPVNSFGYAYPSSGFYYYRPGFSIAIGSGYRGFGYGYGGYGYGGYGYGAHHFHHHHH
jgi:hypothetical protein